MNKLVNILLAEVGCAGAVFSVIMLYMAFQLLEWGRVLFYLLLAIISAEVGICVFLRALKTKM